MKTADRSQLNIYQEQPLNAGTPLDILRSAFLTPQERFFIRSHGPIPEIEQTSYRLRVTGLVQRPLELSCEELRSSFREHTITATLQCAGSRRNELAKLRPIHEAVLWGADPISTAEWRGVLLRDVLQAAGITADARYVAFTGLDTMEKAGELNQFGASIELKKALAPEVLLAYAMNGAPLMPEHGFPLRALVPGYIGARSVKWLQEITVQAQPSTNYFQAHDYKTFPPNVVEETADWSQGQPLAEIPLNAVICQPCAGATLPAGPVHVQGYALTGENAPIARVELSVNNGMGWQEARLVTQREPWSWCFWEATLHLPAGEHQLIVRAWDSAGRTQPEHIEQIWNFKGYANNAWHRVNIHVMQN